MDSWVNWTTPHSLWLRWQRDCCMSQVLIGEMRCTKCDWCFKVIASLSSKLKECYLKPPWSHWYYAGWCYGTALRGSSYLASVLDLIGGSSRSATPSLVTRKSPTMDQGVQVNQPGSTPIKDDKKSQQQLPPQSQQMQAPHPARDG